MSFIVLLILRFMDFAIEAADVFGDQSQNHEIEKSRNSILNLTIAICGPCVVIK